MSEQAEVTPILLSICIPTFNRAKYLRDCLDSLERAAAGHRDSIEVLISDNDSTDDTADVIKQFQQRFPLRYFKNERNIGAEPNFFAVAGRATAEHVWIFGDDDIFEDEAISEILPYIRKGYDVIVANFSSWSREMDRELKPACLPWTSNRTYNDRNRVLFDMRMRLGYISSIVVRKNIYFAASPQEYERFIPYGFPHPFSIYCGLLPNCRVAYEAKPLFRQREDNCESYLGPNGLAAWLNTFFFGAAEIYDALREKGYSRIAVRRAKDRTLQEYRPGLIIRKIESVDRRKLFGQMWLYYRSSWHFWFFWVPALFLPKSLLRVLHKIIRAGN